jgi:hypothetical protein
VAGLVATSTTLADAYDGMLAHLTSPDPQVVPAEILERVGAADARELLAWPGWREVAAFRGGPQAPDAGLAFARRLATAFG